MNGIILVDKPQDWTSHDVVGKLRGILHERRIGHSGTLDPMATGLLVVFVGRATRAVEFAEADSKRYVAGLRLGMTTDTQDTSGTVLSQVQPQVSAAELERALEKFTGHIEQIPPMYSAIKVGGKKLYELARRGESIERKPRSICIHSIELLGSQGEDLLLDVSCSKGTYIRTLCHDIGQSLGCGACMSQLRRTQAGPFRLGDAHTIEQIELAARQGALEGILLPVDSLFEHFPALTASCAAEKRLRCGNVIKCNAKPGRYRVYSESEEFLLLGEVSDGQMRTVKSFFEV